MNLQFGTFVYAPFVHDELINKLCYKNTVSAIKTKTKRKQVKTLRHKQCSTSANRRFKLKLSDQPVSIQPMTLYKERVILMLSLEKHCGKISVLV